MSDRYTPDCECCDGIGGETPRRLDNPPGQSALYYRIARHGDYLAAMQARLSSRETPALAALTSREASDLGIAITDALSCSLEVLGFYTERYVQEHYLRTATERLSVREMARLIGYRLAPGVAAATHLAFTLQDAPGAPRGAHSDPIEIPIGTRVQSVPGQDEQAQTFETVAAAPARAAWNALAVQHDEPRIPVFGDTELWLAGSDTGLETGDLLLIVGAEQENDPSDERWDVRVLTEVEPFPERELTRVRWAEGLGHTNPFVLPAGEAVRLYTFRGRATAFGANAPDWRILSDEAKASYLGLLDSYGNTYPEDLTAKDHAEWPDFSVLAPVYPERREGEGGGGTVFVPPTIDEVANAARGAAQGAAVQALHKATASSTGVVAAGGKMAANAFNAARDSAEAMVQVAQLAANEVTSRVQAMLNAVQDEDNPSIAGVVSNLTSNLPGVVSGVLSDDAPSLVVDTIAVLNPAETLETLGEDATRISEHTRDAVAATLGAEAASGVAALVGAAVTIARNLPAPLAPTTPEALASVARHFAALGVARAGGTPPINLAASELHTQIEAQLPPALAGTLEISEELLELTGEAETLANAPREGALIAFEQIVSAVDKSLLGGFKTGSTRLAPLVRSPDTIDITPRNESVVAGGWALLAVPTSIELYGITHATSASRAENLLSGQTTRLTLSGELPDGRLPAEFEHAVRELAVHVESEELTLARTPLASPLYGDRIALDGLAEDLLPGQPLALRGKRPRIRIARGSKDIGWIGEDGETRLLGAGDSLTLVEPPRRQIEILSLLFSPGLAGGKGLPFAKTPQKSTEKALKTLSFYLPPDTFAATVGDHEAELRLVLEDRDRARGEVVLRGSDILIGEPEDADPEVAEIVFLTTTADAVTNDRTRSYLRLSEATRHCYFRRGTALNANCVPATHGETVEALLGSGDGSVPNQTFTLSQAPLTHVSADTPSGGASTLELRVNDVLWQEQPSLYQAAPDARVFRTRDDDDGVTTIEFGDGSEGARLPSGESNVRARYRKGLGVAGNVGPGKLTTLLTRPLGVAEVTNPEAATGGEDGETLDRARTNAPLTVLTLDRAVSIRDYADYARAFSGIDKAHALWIPAGPARGVFLTIAGVAGAAVPETSETYQNLSASLRRFGDPLLPLRILDYRDARFRCRLAVKVHADYETDPVIAAVEAALREGFAFARRDFGQMVSVDEVTAIAQAVAGAEAVHATRLYRDEGSPGLQPRLFAALPVASLAVLPVAAELLTLSDAPIELEVLP